MESRTIEVREEWIVEPHTEQRGFLLDSTHRYVALEGGLGAGKTFAGSVKLVALHLHNAFDADGQPTYCASACVGDIYRNLYRYDVPAILEASERMGLRAVVRKNRDEVLFPDLGVRDRPSVVYLNSAEKPERISGYQCGAFWGDEAARWKEAGGDPKTDPLLQLRGRLRDRKANCQQGIYTYTNEGDGTAIYSFMREVDRATAEPKSDRTVYRISARDNIAVREMLEDQLYNLSADLIAQYVDGFAVNVRGAHAYGSFDASPAPGGNLDSSLALDPAIPLTLSLDFNIAPGMHGLIGQYHRASGILRVLHEIHGPRMDVVALVERFGQLLGQTGGFPYPGLIICGDASGRGQWAGTSESHYSILWQCLKKLAFGRPMKRNVPFANPRQSNRVNSVNCALRDVGGRVHLLIHTRCAGLIEDLKVSKWDDRGKELEKNDPRSTHFSDALGYWVHRVRPVLVRLPSVGGRFSTRK